ncbi:DUF512 domain-containing protein [Natroniella sulfidigena]|uniref:DUF512 domain-containing protein n=1 Tax=Natroniella sulfidigena TaxID=723921 RepID=UPI00200AE673|nr:DUF512 domain-containing protein [Natroniella sulfidigena]MCK8816132.1 DUF512 domain-containing protein [Natroniella sulfidigena]
MEYTEQQLAILSAQKENILPVTSVCNLSCLFCSHQGNPANVEVFSSGHRSLAELKEIIPFLNADSKIVIGESATRICEGEPFTHPQIMELLKLVRSQFPDTLLQMTTNGINLTTERLRELARLRPIELNLSVNSIGSASRKKLMNQKQEQSIIDVMKGLQELEIIYHGSIVALPTVTGWSKLEATIAALESYGAQTVRVFLPGYTRFSPSKMKFKLSLWEQLTNFFDDCRTKYQVPIMLEPVKLSNLEAEILGIIDGSSASASQIEVGDRIIEVDGVEVISRVDAFQQLLSSEDPQIKLERQGEIKEVVINKSAGQKSGLIFSYDLAPQLVEKLERVINYHHAEQILILTSVLATEVIKEGLQLLLNNNPTWQLEVATVNNDFFGGSILCAGLLVVDDFRKVLLDYQEQLAEIDLILLPGIAFDNWGRDLTGEEYQKLEEEFGVVVEVVD